MKNIFTRVNIEKVLKVISKIWIYLVWFTLITELISDGEIGWWSIPAGAVAYVLAMPMWKSLETCNCDKCCKK